MRRLRGLLVGVAAGLLAGGAARAAEPAIPAGELEFFEKKVRPVLIARCYECHSTAKKVKGNLKLDTKEGWAKGGDAGPAIVPGDPENSLIIQAVKHAKQDLEMPPDGRMPEAEIAVLAEWVKRGAHDPRTGTPAGGGTGTASVYERTRGHWAYQPIRPVAVPPVKGAAWAKGDVDQFILAGLEARGLAPAAEASPEVLVRRAYFDLHGLPPTPEEIDAYVNDAAPDRFERLVDRLLASPRFGERFGRHWLDVARFGESLTLRGFVIKDAWRYRDYVIEQFNADRAFDLFMREQVAGDLMPHDTPEQRKRQVVATEFLTIGNTNLEEQDKKQLDMDVVDEQLDTLGKAFLGQTLGCARCHDHKFDPVTAKDYYALAGILRSAQTLEHANVSKWVEMPLPTDPAREAEVKAHEAKVAEMAERVRQAKALLAKADKPVKGAKKAGPAAGDAIDPAELPGFVVDDAQAKRVGVWRVSQLFKPFVGEGYAAEERDADPKQVRTLTFILPDKAETGKYEVRLAYNAAPARGERVHVTVFGADGEKSVDVNMRQSPPIDGLWVSLGQHLFEKGGQSFVIVSTQDAGGNVVADAVQFIPADQVVVAAAGNTKGEIAADLAAGGQMTSTVLKRMEGDLKKMQESGPKRETAQVVRERPDAGDIRVHVRGSPHTLGEVAPRGFLSVVPVKDPPQVPAKQSGRFELGQWLSAADNPLPARVTANRVWHWLFGAGIVRSTDNFGTTGELPSHPELLDYLATRLVQEKWSIKALVRQVVTSRAYRMSSMASPDAVKADPENRLVSRQNRRRLEAEALRDAMLAVSGQLKFEGAGGPTYKPGMTSDFAYKHAGDVRRSVYVPAFRNAMNDVFEVFDVADPSVGTGRRNASTVAPQALFMLNHPFVAEQATAAAERFLADGGSGDDEARLRQVYRAALGRAPTAGEAKVALAFVKEEGNSKDAWRQVIQAVFGSVDFRYVE
ncbi:MAG TPA: DUF1553 domain-containing protein [Tepidisphaeraceae bacterium]|nr:DUF1553 domain-containing protein [Tepidisphaeraceae bacterium]